LLGLDILFEQSLLGRAPLKTSVQILLPIWVLLSMAWVPLAAMGTGMAFEGETAPFRSYLSIAIFWFYPTLVLLAFLFRRRNPHFVYMPLLGILTMIAAVAMEWP